ncbi:hypothetical protein BH09PSE1_BH09PSE1_00830 [soil metagenome]
MRRSFRLSLPAPLLAAALLATAHPAAAQYIHMSDFPEIYGTYAMQGDCTKFPRVIADAAGVRIVTAAGTSIFNHTDVGLGFNGREDHSITVFTQGVGEGLIMQFADGEMSTASGERLGPAERAVEVLTRTDSMRRCGAHAAVPVVEAEPEPAPMRATASTSAAELADLEVMTDPGFRSAYLQALGPLQSETWLIDMQGPGDQTTVTVSGATLLQVNTCKDRDCGDNAMVVLYRPQPRAVWGIVSVHRRRTVIGNPPPAILARLQRMFAETWPAG